MFEIALLWYMPMMMVVLMICAMILTTATALSTPTFQRNPKTVTLLRHGCSYMNEYLGGADNGSSFGSPGFTDVFSTQAQRDKYHDSPLSSRGIQQVRRIGLDLSSFDVVLVSPLQRALQTYDQGVHTALSRVPVIAAPQAAERLYLVSDLGRPVAQLQPEFPYVDFDTYFDDAEQWWYQPPSKAQTTEWRPTGKDQRYACPGEPYDAFRNRMRNLCNILNERIESRILLVCHHGVIEHLLGGVDFGNCEHRTVPMEKLQQRFDL